MRNRNIFNEAKNFEENTLLKIKEENITISVENI